MKPQDAAPFSPDATDAYRQRVDAAATALHDRVGAVPERALLLGTGAGLVEDINVDASCPYAELPHFPSESEAARQGTVVVGTLDGTRVLVLTPPLFLHEGHTPRQVAFPIRMLGVTGVETLISSGRAGGLRPEFGPGDLMLVTNHVNFQGLNPLVGPNVEEWGPRFPDMTDPYAPALQRAAGAIARREGLALRKGVYLAVVGPSLGTGAEHRMMQTLGADAVGIGLVPEVIAARHMGLRVAAVTVITERCAPDAPPQAETEHTGPELADARLQRLLKGLVTASVAEAEVA